MMTYGDLCMGFGGTTTGALQAGLKPLWGIERDPEIAAVARRNFDHLVIEADMLDCDPLTLEPVNALHVSLPCISFSVANNTGGETEQDIALARKVAMFIDVMQPRVFTLENVWLYRRSASWAIIRDTLYKHSYWLDVAHVNAADFSVPQTRKRMIVRAVRSGMIPYLPPAEPWRGWYEAIEDIIPDLPDSQFADWQLDRLAGDPKTALFSQGISRDANGDDYGVAALRERDEPSFTITASRNMNGIRAFIVSNSKIEWGSGVRDGSEPAFSVTQQSGGRVRALLVGDQKRQLRRADEPSFTVRAGGSGGATPRAWPDYGRVVQMTPRALARFQTIPDWYELPESKALACKGIGNAVPPLLYRRALETLL